ncbi:MAG TPA: hypothetical protein VFF12_14005, partial [Myxococcaceae bacterium]|nr:hypothetical protein [Myxococcaceae bacterium]
HGPPPDAAGPAHAPKLRAPMSVETGPWSELVCEPLGPEHAAELSWVTTLWQGARPSWLV